MVVRDYERLNFALFLATRDGAEFRVGQNSEFRVERERGEILFLSR